MTKLTDEKIMDEILSDEDTVKLLERAWTLRQEERWLTRKANQCEYDAKEAEQEVMKRHELDFSDFIYLMVVEEHMFDEKMQGKWSEGKNK